MIENAQAGPSNEKQINVHGGAILVTNQPIEEGLCINASNINTYIAIISHLEVTGAYSCLLDTYNNAEIYLDLIQFFNNCAPSTSQQPFCFAEGGHAQSLFVQISVIWCA